MVKIFPKIFPTLKIKLEKPFVWASDFLFTDVPGSVVGADIMYPLWILVRKVSLLLSQIYVYYCCKPLLEETVGPLHDQQPVHHRPKEGVKVFEWF